MASAGADLPPRRKRGAVNLFLMKVLDHETLEALSPSTSLGSTSVSPVSSFSTSPWQTTGTAGAAAAQPDSDRKRSSAEVNSVDPIEEKLARFRSPSKPANHGGGSRAGVLASSSGTLEDVDAEQQPPPSRMSFIDKSANETIDLIERRLSELTSPSKAASRNDTAPIKPSSSNAHELGEAPGLLALKGPESDAVDKSSPSDGALVPYSHLPNRHSTHPLPNVCLPVHTSLLAPGDLSPFGHGRVVLKQTGITISRKEYKAKCEVQRNSRNLWKPGFIFPGQDHLPGADRNIFDRASLIRTNEFICYGILGCPYGDCLHQLKEIDISSARQRLQNIVATKQASKFAAGR